MFPSFGRFARLTCPSTGRCERPHCWYKHGKEERLLFGASSSLSSSLNDVTGGQDVNLPPVCQAHVNQLKDESSRELERLKKEIETVKYEVALEQRRLSRYRSAEAASKPVSSNGENANKGSYGHPSSSDGFKALSRSRKYVVDNSKPRTDLEYDPMSNYSADFGSYKSLGKAQKGKSTHQKPVSHQVPLCCPASTGTQDNSDDESILIIDMPPSPAPAPKHASCDADAPQDTKKQHEEIGAVHEVREDSNEGCEASAGSVIDLTRCLEHLGGESPEATCLQSSEDKSCSTLQARDQNVNRAVMEEDDDSVCVEWFKCGAPNAPQNSLLSDTSPYLPSVVKPTQKAQQTTEYNSSLPPFTPSTANCTAAHSHQGPAEPSPGSSQLQTEAESSPVSSSEHPLSKAAKREVIVIVSSSDEEEEQGYPGLDLSDSDPEEECYRIFMEAEESANHQQPEIKPMDVAKLDISTVTPQEQPAKRRIAHEAKDTELPVAKRRPQPQILVPLRGPATPLTASRLAATPKIQQIQQKASMVTASVKGGQAFLSSFGQRRQESQPATSTPAAVNASPAARQNQTYVNYVPLGSAVLNVGNNLRLILPQGAVPLPLSSASSAVTSVLNITPVLARPPTCTASAVASAQKYRMCAPLLFTPAARRPSQPSTPFTSSLSTTATSTPALAAAKPGAIKRKAKPQVEASKDKVPHDVRQRYVTMFVEAFLASTANVNEAFEKALVEEKAVYNRSGNKLKYLSVAVNALKRLKKHNSAAAKDDKVNGKTPKGNIPLNRKTLKGNDDTALYEILRDYILTEEQLIENNYPMQNPEKAGCAVLFADKKGSNDPLKRICCRCGATYSVSQTGKHTRTEECNYHYGKGVENRVPGGVETRYSCCQGVMGAPGCQLFKLHVHDSFSLDGFVGTAPRSPTDTSCPGIYSLDCEMCYTIHGLELSRVTVVNSSLQVVYDTFVKPRNEVIDYNTRFSGISEEDVRGNHTFLSEVQKTLLSFISTDTIIIGHGLETGLCALKSSCLGLLQIVHVRLICLVSTKFTERQIITGCFMCSVSFA
ncbi:RNA exonuclease 1 homolog isoform X2 [Dunckerocampus dactyliophorus]|uniref:RNA exonuclease 1 homolog isoform X2 n=1 Tax=Dunckerocampus dactyliophorus TaxID=161453 RepID=UPI0024057D6A|nr:RNA exonuclease 1 homolog isoform X2 [Dunckerocampus dactyliophorus]